MPAKTAPNPVEATAAPVAAWPRWLWLLIPLAGILVYANSLNGPFIFDDADAITRNSSIRSFWTAFFPGHDLPVSGRPIVNLSFALNYALGQFNVAGYHVVNVALHLACGILLYQVVRRALCGTAAIPPEHSDPLAIMVALIWIVHPLNTEAVTYITQRTELIVSCFLLLTLFFLGRAADSPGPRNRLWMILAIVACGFGMASKEVMVVAPLLALLYDRAFLAKSFEATFKQRWMLHVGLWATLLILAVLIFENPRSQSAGLGGFERFTRKQYFLTEWGVLIYYLRLVFVPHPLVLDYEDWPTANSIADVWLPGLGVGLLAAAGLFAFVRNHWSGFWAAWFFAILAPTSSILVIASEVIAERRMYLPSAGVIAIAVIGAYVVLREMLAQAPQMAQRAVGLATVTLCIALGGTAIARNAVYGNAFGIWEDALAKRPDNTRAMLNLCTLHRDRAMAAGASNKPIPGDPDWRIAYDLAERAIRVLAENGIAHQIYAHLLLTDNRREEALVQYAEAVRLRPEQLDSREQLIVLLMERRRFDEARREIESTLRFWPLDYVALRSMGMLHAQSGDLAGAVQFFRKSLQGAPTLRQQIEARLNVAAGCKQLGQKAEAAAMLNEILRIEPNNPDARQLLGQLGISGGP